MLPPHPGGCGHGCLIGDSIAWRRGECKLLFMVLCEGRVSPCGAKGYFALRRDFLCPRRKRDVSPCGATFFAYGGKEGKTSLESTVAPCRFPRLNGAPIGVLPRNRLAASATGGASAVSLFGSRLPPSGSHCNSEALGFEKAFLPLTNRSASFTAAAHAFLVGVNAQTCRNCFS